MALCAARIWHGGAGAQCTKEAVDGEDFCRAHGTELKEKQQKCRGCNKLVRKGTFCIKQVGDEGGGVAGHAHARVRAAEDGDDDEEKNGVIYHRYRWEHFGRIDAEAPANFEAAAAESAGGGGDGGAAGAGATAADASSPSRPSGSTSTGATSTAPPPTYSMPTLLNESELWSMSQEGLIKLVLKWQQHGAAAGAGGSKAKRGANEGPLQPAAKKTKIEKVCTYFLEGTCTRGAGCRFQHTGAGDTSARARPGQQFRSREKERQVAEGTFTPEKVETAREIMCRGHNEPCIRRVVNKPFAKNNGRSYYQCARSGDESCKHFSWGSQENTE